MKITFRRDFERPVASDVIIDMPCVPRIGETVELEYVSHVVCKVQYIVNYITKDATIIVHLGEGMR
jgi:hypothetical protein